MIILVKSTLLSDSSLHSFNSCDSDGADHSVKVRCSL